MSLSPFNDTDLSDDEYREMEREQGALREKLATEEGRMDKGELENWCETMLDENEILLRLYRFRKVDNSRLVKLCYRIHRFLELLILYWLKENRQLIQEIDKMRVEISAVNQKLREREKLESDTSVEKQ